ncbi:hypothetical protein BGZ79_006745 [Entomortierella chlamydospora]|nr:hypothetical protein BGZ79_006745 [Entomortierella chlamydospora]
MVSRPAYGGAVMHLPWDVITHGYFRTTKISEWSLEGFLTSTGLTPEEFKSSLKQIARIKRLPIEIQIFAKWLNDYYCGIFQEEVVEIAENEARKTVNRTLLSGKEHLLLQGYVNDSLERDKSTDEDQGEEANVFHNGTTDVFRSNQSTLVGSFSWIRDRPDFNFHLKLSTDWGPKMTAEYNKARKLDELTHKNMDQICLLSGILHVNEKHSGFNENEIESIRKDALSRFYTKKHQDNDLKRAKHAVILWSRWVQKLNSVLLDRKLAMMADVSQTDKDRHDTDQSEVDDQQCFLSSPKGHEFDSLSDTKCLQTVLTKRVIEPKSSSIGNTDDQDDDQSDDLNTSVVIDDVISTYDECKTHQLLPLFEVALHVFRHYCTWVGHSGNSNTASIVCKTRKESLEQDGQARQPDVVGRTPRKEEAYFGELKGLHPTTLSLNSDLLRLAVFTKDSLDVLLRVLERDPPVVSFRTVGGTVRFFLGAKVDNTIVHINLSDVQLPTVLTALNCDLEFFYNLFQINTLVHIASRRLQLRRDNPLKEEPFPTLATPHRNQALGIQGSLRKTRRSNSRAPGSIRIRRRGRRPGQTRRARGPAMRIL